ncbi:hypothetical protein VTJ83DRAFT_6207 [Remersonia thermophila]|uniref:C2H2-type domain-containing protein n=1 Tax=Remersonia thermophila TaxID=72144 RepID=A0ABR4D475_9PEZI
MEHPSAGMPGPARPAQKDDGDSGVVETPRPAGLPPVTTGEGELMIHKETGMGGLHLGRRDTDESGISSYTYYRTNTTFSVLSAAESTVTDFTELNSPDVSGFPGEAEPDVEAAALASSPRRGGLLALALPLQKKRLSVRGPLVSWDDAEKPRNSPSSPTPDTPASHWRRLLEPTSPRPSGLSRSLDPGNASAPEPGHDARTEPGPSKAVGSGEPRGVSSSEDHEEAGEGHRHKHDAATGETRSPSPSFEPSPQGQEATAVQGRRTDDLPRPSSPRSPSPGRELEKPAVAARSLREDDLARIGDDGIVHDTCKYVLKEAFGVRLDEVALAGAASAVHESVSYCLDELAHILRAVGLGDVSSWSREASHTFSGWLAPAGRDGNGPGSHEDAGDNSLKRVGGGDGGGDGGDENADSAGGSGDGNGGSKRRKASSAQAQPPGIRYSCPFRKRNPLRFNVRDFQICAVQDFSDLSLVKRHVKTFHRQSTLPFTCPRCRRSMGSPEALDEHLSVDPDQMCAVRKVPAPPDPEDGITARIERELNERKSNKKIGSWEAMWKLLFPRDDDHDIPEPDFIPPTELEEVYAQFHAKNHTDQLRRHVWEALLSTSDADNILSVVESHIEAVFEASREATRKAGSRRRQLRLQTGSLLVHPKHPSSMEPSSLPLESSTSPIAAPGYASVRSSGLPRLKHPVPGKQGSLRSESSISSPILPPGWTPTLDANRERPSETGWSTPTMHSPSAVGVFGMDHGSSPRGCLAPFANIRRDASQGNAAASAQAAANAYATALGLLGESYAIPFPGQPPGQQEMGGAPVMLNTDLGASQAPAAVPPVMGPFDTPSSSQALGAGPQIPGLFLQPSCPWMLGEPSMVDGPVHSPAGQNAASAGFFQRDSLPLDNGDYEFVGRTPGV